ncbi:hypothetical protein BP6252_12036 [Coleophoma cylindrospora]|uniref:Ca2+-modulated nonselective cation channel polycystin n=1 Tax=Coleophoma cylindrospora TaxID=1849047 RepID=A0A3D8QFP2_9HELO|nr:hypothetical protein BP6252_12036 [Coleophoma cylindrospora]
MATAETAQHAHERPDRSGRRRPFSAWMKKLANLKGGSSSGDSNHTGTKRNAYQMKSQSKKNGASKNNNPYPESGIAGDSTAPAEGNPSFSTVPTGDTISSVSLERSRDSNRSSEDGLPPPTIGNKSMAGTMGTDVAHSDVAPSHAPSSGDATTGTVGGGVNSARGQDSTFSSPAPSVRSMTTTLTTIQSAATPAGTNVSSGGHASNGNNGQSIQFVHQFPSSPPPSALPAHLVPQGSGGHPATYNTATANNLLTDNASILTLASSSKRRRRRSMDTDASVRALAPSSLFGGSRESLPLSVLSSNIEPNATTTASGLHQSRANVGAAERASIYSATGVTPALPSERNSFYAGKQTVAGDGSSIKSGMVGHGKAESASGSPAGAAVPGSPLASPRDASGPGRISRNNSGWGDVTESPTDPQTERVEEGHIEESEKS